MSNQDAELLKKAEELENESKFAVKSKDYAHAISRLLVAKEIYAKLGLTGQVGIIIRDIVRLKNLQKEQPAIRSSTPVHTYKSVVKPKIENDEISPNNELGGNNLLEEARTLTLDDKLDDALKKYEKAYEIFEKLHYDYECRQILWQINEIRDYIRRGASLRSRGIKVKVKDIVTLASAERRRLKIQEQQTTKKSYKLEKPPVRKEPTQFERATRKIFEQRKLSEQREAELKKESQSAIKSQQELLKKQRIEKQEKLRLLKEKKKQEEITITEAEKLLDQGNKMLQNRDYNEAKKYYLRSIELFTKLGWMEQVKLLQNELKNIDHYKKEEELKYQQVYLSRQKTKQEVQKKVDSALSEKQRLEESERLNRVIIPPEVKNKLEKINLLKIKADKEEQAQNYVRVLSRYEYILDVYQSVPKDIIDLSQEISNIEAKIIEIKSKL
jgi:hypothetical protein